MKAIDTNIIVRFLVGDDEQQSQRAYQLFKNAESAKKELFVHLLVILEVVWVLESVYEIEREKIIEALRELMLMPVLRFEQQPAIQKFLQNAQKNSHDLSDLLIAHSAGEQGCEAVITFDKKASQYSLFELAK